MPHVLTEEKLKLKVSQMMIIYLAFIVNSNLSYSQEHLERKKYILRNNREERMKGTLMVQNQP